MIGLSYHTFVFVFENYAKYNMMNCAQTGKKTVKYTDQLDNSSWNVLGFDTLRFIRLIAHWSVENIKPDMTPYRMLLDVIVSPKNKKKGTTNIILIRLSSVMIVVGGSLRVLQLPPPLKLVAMI
jgi:hypothetical protein